MSLDFYVLRYLKNTTSKQMKFRDCTVDSRYLKLAYLE